MAELIMITRGHGSYTNKDAVEKVIRYITRTRWCENRQNELIAYGGAGVGIYLNPAEIIRQFLYVQNIYNINNRGGRRIYHEVLSFTDYEFQLLNWDYNSVLMIAQEISKFYYENGHQVLFGIHYSEEKRLHIHFAVNTINYRTGLKWHSSKIDLEQRKLLFNEIIKKYQYIFIRKSVIA